MGQIIYLATHSIVVGSRPSVIYEVVDSFKLEPRQVLRQSGGSCAEDANPPEFVAVLVLCCEGDAILLPSNDPALCYPPVPGTGSYCGSSIRLSVVFWRDEFWAPILGSHPSRRLLAEESYGLDDSSPYGLDVLYKVRAEDLPPILESIGDAMKSKDPAVQPWLSPRSSKGPITPLEF